MLFASLFSFAISLLPHLLTPAAELQDGQEDVDHVDVELDGGEDVLLGGDGVLFAPHDLLGVVDQEHREEEGHQSGVDGVGDRVGLGQEKHRQDAEDEEDPAGGEQVHADSLRKEGDN